MKKTPKQATKPVQLSGGFMENKQTNQATKMDLGPKKYTHKFV